jgi:hypothetical protein
MCGDELTLDMVKDLLNPDPDELPEVKEYGEGGSLRKISSFSVRSPEQGHGEERELVFERSISSRGEYGISVCFMGLFAGLRSPG